MPSFSERVKAWFRKPYSDDMSVAGWAAFFAFTVIAMFLWTRVLRVIVLSVNK